MPTVILPIFFKFSDLEDGKLKTDIFKEAEKTKIPVSQIKVIDGSQRSSHSNAFVTGFGAARKVVIFDTLIEQQSPEEILAVVNHELGHVAYHHVVWGVGRAIIQLAVMFSFFSLCIGNRDILRSFNFTRTSNFVSLFLFQMLYSPSSFFTQFLQMYLTRVAEF